MTPKEKEGQSEAEYMQKCDYQEYLDSLFTSGQKDLYAINRCLDMLKSEVFVKSGLTEKEYLIYLQSKLESITYHKNINNLDLKL